MTKNGLTVFCEKKITRSDFFRAIAQLVARYVRDVEVPGSNPGCPTRKEFANMQTLFFILNYFPLC